MFKNDSLLRPNGCEVDLLIPFEKFLEIEIESLSSLFIQMDPKRLGPFHEKVSIFSFHMECILS
jgi:hypothetical protein